MEVCAYLCCISSDGLISPHTVAPYSGIFYFWHILSCRATPHVIVFWSLRVMLVLIWFLIATGGACACCAPQWTAARPGYSVPCGGGATGGARRDQSHSKGLPRRDASRTWWRAWCGAIRYTFLIHEFIWKNMICWFVCKFRVLGFACNVFSVAASGVFVNVFL